VDAVICLSRNYISIQTGIGTEFVSDRMSYILLRSQWCGSIVLNIPAPTEDKNNGSNHSLYEELEFVLVRSYILHEHLLQDLGVKVGRLAVGSRIGTSGSYT
jgi:hypothetical protein